MTGPVAVDASVVIKWFIPNPDSDLADSVSRYPELVAPHLVISETLNGLTRLFRAGSLEKQALERAAKFLENQNAIHLVDDSRHATQAARLSVLLDHSAYDCLYLAVAVQHGAAFLTADTRFLAKLDGHRDLQAATLRLTDWTEAPLR